jgi:phosphohistidine phosphatase
MKDERRDDLRAVLAPFDLTLASRMPEGPKPPTVDLILWRHAEAQERSDDGDDLSRALTRKGQRQALRMAAWLDLHIPAGTRVLVSPARRAEETAHALGRNFKRRDELRPLASPEEALSLLKWDPVAGPQVKGPVLMIGHRHALAPLAARLLGMEPDSVMLRKAAVWWLRGRALAGQYRCSVVAAMSPELLAAG